MCYGLFFTSLKRRPKKDFLGPKLFFLIKIENFYQKKWLRSDRFSPRTPFERSEKQCVPCLNFILKINKSYY